VFLAPLEALAVQVHLARQEVLVQLVCPDHPVQQDLRDRLVFREQLANQVQLVLPVLQAPLGRLVFPAHQGPLVVLV